VVKLVKDLEKTFGTVIMDEAHHVPAATFTKVIDNMHCKYRIALSGTMERKDGKQILFRDIFGAKIFKPPQNNTINPIVKVIKTGIHTLPGAPWVKKINALLYDDNYQEFIARIARTQIDKGHKVLIIADRTKFLQKVHEYIG
jgi:superfamily II DNA or RNA helicase